MVGSDKVIKICPVQTWRPGPRGYSVGMRKLTCQNGLWVFPELHFLIHLICYKNYVTMLNKTYHSKNSKYQYLWKSGFEICSPSVQSLVPQVLASEKPLKLHLEVLNEASESPSHWDIQRWKCIFHQQFAPSHSHFPFGLYLTKPET